MNSVRKVKRKQYDNLVIIAFFPPTVFGRAERHIRRGATSRLEVQKPGQPTQGSSGGCAETDEYMGKMIAIISALTATYMFN